MKMKQPMVGSNRFDPLKPKGDVGLTPFHAKRDSVSTPLQITGFGWNLPSWQKGFGLNHWSLVSNFFCFAPDPRPVDPPLPWTPLALDPIPLTIKTQTYIWVAHCLDPREDLPRERKSASGAGGGEKESGIVGPHPSSPSPREGPQRPPRNPPKESESDRRRGGRRGRTGRRKGKEKGCV